MKHFAKDDPSYCIYFIRAGLDGPIKIGIALDVLKRLGQMQVNNHSQLYILATMPESGESVEAELHKRFAADNLNGEWFKPSRELLDFIRIECTPWTDVQPAKTRAERAARRDRTRTIQATVYPEIAEQLKQAAKRTGRTKSDIIAEAVADFIDAYGSDDVGSQ